MSDTPLYFGAIIERTIHHEGDERSRTHPGHGYPEHTETVKEFKEFKDEQEFRRWMEYQESRSGGRPTYKAIVYKPVVVEKKMAITTTW